MEANPVAELVRRKTLRKLSEHLVKLCEDKGIRLSGYSPWKNDFRVAKEIISRWVFVNIALGCMEDAVLPGPCNLDYIVRDIKNIGRVQEFDLCKKDVRAILREGLDELERLDGGKMHIDWNGKFLFFEGVEAPKIPLSKHIEGRLKKRYVGDEGDYLTSVGALVMRMEALGSYNNQLSVLPEIKDKLMKELGINYEFFGSPINVDLPNYFSAFPDIDRVFGSGGSFFSLGVLPSRGLINPPYDEKIMEMTATTLLYEFENRPDDDLLYVVTIPSWQDNEEVYGLFQAWNILKEMRWTRDVLHLQKANMPYIDHFTGKLVKAVATTIILLQSDKSFEKNPDISLESFF